MRLNLELRVPILTRLVMNARIDNDSWIYYTTRTTRMLFYDSWIHYTICTTRTDGQVSLTSRYKSWVLDILAPRQTRNTVHCSQTSSLAPFSSTKSSVMSSVVLRLALLTCAWSYNTYPFVMCKFSFSHFITGLLGCCRIRVAKGVMWLFWCGVLDIGEL